MDMKRLLSRHRANTACCHPQTWLGSKVSSSTRRLCVMANANNAVRCNMMSKDPLTQFPTFTFYRRAALTSLYNMFRSVKLIYSEQHKTCNLFFCRFACSPSADMDFLLRFAHMTLIHETMTQNFRSECVCLSDWLMSGEACSSGSP